MRATSVCNENEHRTENDWPSPAPPPVMTWEEFEQGEAGQLNFPALTPVPTVAERAFLVIAREWQAKAAKTPKDHALPRAADESALACLLLAVEHGAEFTPVAWNQMEANQLTVGERRERSWMDKLSWQLCLAANCMAPPKSEAVRKLTANLDHPSSSIRCWMMELGWFTVAWLNPVEASVRLLKNLADTLGGVSLAAGLATRIFEKPESFFEFAKTFTPPAGFEEQYQDRLQCVEKEGVLAMQAPFWRTEAHCRKEIERAGLAFKMWKSPQGGS